MPSKPDARISASTAAGALPSFGLVSIEGKDAADFLQRQTMNDVRDLDVAGAWQWNGLLSAKGRVLVLFALLRGAGDRFCLVLPDGDAAHWAETLRRVVFRSKVTLTAHDEAQAFGVIDVDLPEPRAEAHRATACGNGWWLDFSGESVRRALLIGDEAPTGLRQALAGCPDAAIEWAYEDLRHGLPHLPPSRRDAHTPQMLGLDRLRAFSVRKGCYPGQEIVARTHFLGQAKRTLQRLASDRAFADSVLCDGQTVPVFDRIDIDDRHEALAVLPSTATTCAHADGHPVQIRPFAAGLARGPGEAG